MLSAFTLKNDLVTYFAFMPIHACDDGNCLVIQPGNKNAERAAPNTESADAQPPI